MDAKSWAKSITLNSKKKKKKEGKLQAKAIRIIKFLPNNASITKNERVKNPNSSKHSLCERFTDK